MRIAENAESLIRAAAGLIDEADGILITAGAGMGVASGLPDFRGNDGFWKAYEALGRAKIQFTEIANGMAFAERPELAWGFYGHRLKLYRSTVPHGGFALLQEMASTKPQGAFVYTSNVDGAFEKSGFLADRVTECHGSIHYVQCSRPCSDKIWPADHIDPVIDEANCLMSSAMPICPDCGALARPNILMFNDRAWVDKRTVHQQHFLDKWLAEGRTLSKRLVVIEIGAGTAIPTVRRMGQYQGCPIVRINPTACEVRGPGVGIQMGALEALTQIFSELKGRG